MRGYYFITDSALSAAGDESDVRQAVAAGVAIVQYRRKDAGTRLLVQEARALKRICAGGRTRFIVNDRLDVAMAAEADGVHLGKEDMALGDARRLLGKAKLIGVSVLTVEEALAAEEQGADYLGVGPVFPTATKADAGAPCGLDRLRAIRSRCRIPVAAIGGIDLENAGAVLQAGADMICAISAVVAQPDVAAEIRKFQEEFER